MSGVAELNPQVYRFSRPDLLRLLAIGLAVAVAYVFTARVGFQFAFVAEQVTTVWAPTGIAQAALLLWGRRLWPAVWVGAFLANIGPNVPVWSAGTVAVGNTLEAVVAVTLLRRASGFDVTLPRIRDVARFVVCGGILSPAISATVGSLTLCVASIQPWARFGTLWLDWWLGDALGAVIVAPAILTIVRARGLWTLRQFVEAGLLAVGTFAVVALLHRSDSLSLETRALEFVIFPFVIAAALRLPPAGTALVVFGASVAAIASPTGESSQTAHQTLILLQAFMGVLAVTGLLLSAAMSERKTGERRRAVAHAIGDVLATAADLPSAAPEILRSICLHLDWRLATLWLVDTDAQRLRCATVWTGPSDRLSAFRQVSLGMTFEAGIGLPGRVWKSHQPAWIDDVVCDSNFPRAPFARDAGIHGAFAFSIDAGGETIGVIECFHGTVLSPDLDLMRTMGAVGQQIGAFVGRRRIEMLRANAEREREDLLQRELAARREAEAANHAKDEFLAMLSHELRTPLNAIVGWTRMLLDGAVEERNVRKALEVIERNGQLQTQLVGDILDVSRIVTGNLQLNSRPYDAGAVIGAALDAIRPSADAKQITLHSTIALPPWRLEGDPERLQQVVWNLLSNAVKFTPDGGTVTIALSHHQDENHVTRLTVTDNGRGIAPSFLPYVFDRFRQADGSVARQHGGLGLGLAIVRHIVELHGGTVRASSDGGGTGATFIVDLPSRPPTTLL